MRLQHRPFDPLQTTSIPRRRTTCLDVASPFTDEDILGLVENIYAVLLTRGTAAVSGSRFRSQRGFWEWAGL